MTREEAIEHASEWVKELRLWREQTQLDKIRADIEQAYCKAENDYDKGRNYGLYMATQIIDNYKE